MTPNDFERAAGRLAAKKWKISIRVDLGGGQPGIMIGVRACVCAWLDGWVGACCLRACVYGWVGMPAHGTHVFSLEPWVPGNPEESDKAPCWACLLPSSAKGRQPPRGGTPSLPSSPQQDWLAQKGCIPGWMAQEGMDCWPPPALVSLETIRHQHGQYGSGRGTSSGTGAGGGGPGDALSAPGPEQPPPGAQQAGQPAGQQGLLPPATGPFLVKAGHRPNCACVICRQHRNKLLQRGDEGGGEGGSGRGTGSAAAAAAAGAATAGPPPPPASSAGRGEHGRQCRGRQAEGEREGEEWVDARWRAGKQAYLQALPQAPTTGATPHPRAALPLSRCWAPGDWVAHRIRQQAREAAAAAAAASPGGGGEGGAAQPALSAAAPGFHGGERLPLVVVCGGTAAVDAQGAAASLGWGVRGGRAMSQVGARVGVGWGGDV